jgi:hypothetical protein
VARTSTKPAPRTTESLIAGLRERGGDVRQQVIAHETLARLRAERGAVQDPKRIAELDVDIRFWLGFVDEDVDQAVPVATDGEPDE